MLLVCCGLVPGLAALCSARASTASELALLPTLPATPSCSVVVLKPPRAESCNREREYENTDFDFRDWLVQVREAITHGPIYWTRI